MYLTCESKEGYKDGISNIIANLSMYQGCDDHECGVEDGEGDDDVPRRRHRVREVVVSAAHRARILQAEEEVRVIHRVTEDHLVMATAMEIRRRLRLHLAHRIQILRDLLVEELGVELESSQHF